MRNRKNTRCLLPFALVLSGVIFLTSSGCFEPADRNASLPDSTLALVIADLYLVDAGLQLEVLSDSFRIDAQTVMSKAGPMRDSILALHGFDDSTFMLAMEVFIQDSDRYIALYDRVLDRLNMVKQAK